MDRRPDPSEWRQEDYASGLDRAIHRYHRRIRPGMPGWIKSGLALTAIAFAVALIDRFWGF